MRKISFLLLVMITALGIVACGTQETAGDKEIHGLIANIGETKDTVWENLKLEEGNNIESSAEMPGSYIFKQQQKFQGEDFQLALNLDVNNDEMYGFMYIKEFRDNAQDGYELAKKLSEAFTKEYGEATTYPELPNRIAKLPAFEELNTGEPVSYTETWTAEDELTLTLQMNSSPNAGIQIIAQYAALKTPGS